MKTTVNGVEIELTKEQIQEIERGQVIGYTPGFVETKEWTRLDTEAYPREIHLYSAGFGMYKTEEEAIKARAKLITKGKILDRIKKLNDGWKPDWEDVNQSKHHILLDTKGVIKNYTRIATRKSLPNRYYFKSEKIFDQLKKEFGDDLRCMVDV